MATLRELLEKIVGRPVRRRSHGQSAPRRSARPLDKWNRSTIAAVLAVGALLGSAASASGYASSTGFVDGYGYAIGTGNGLVLTEFYGFGQNATFRSKWLGAYNSGLVSSNTPGGVNTDLWCIESGVTVTRGYGYSWSTDTNVRARYLMWLANNTWNNPDGRAAIQFLLYADAYPGLGTNNNGGNFDYESRIWAHADFTTGARNYVNTFRTRSTAQMHNSAASLDADSHGGVPTVGDVDGIGVTDAWGNYVPGLSYTLTVTGPAVFDSTGTGTVTGTTAASLINNVHAWTATAAGELNFSVSYANADGGGSVYIGSGGGSQDMVAGAGFRALSISDPTVDAEFMFQPAGDTQVPASSVTPGAPLVDVFTPSAVAPTVWPRENSGDFVPVTYDWALYDTGEVIPGAPATSAPADWTLLEQTQVIATGGPGVPITSAFTSTAQAGHGYAFVVSFANANQPLATQGWFVADWSDQYGLDDEVIYAPATVSPSSMASSEIRGADTAVLDSVTFTGFASDHGTFTGTSVFGPDVATVQQRMYFFPEGLDVTDANAPSAVLMCDLTVPATNGAHQVDDVCGTARKDAWGQYVAGTYVWTSTFAGDARTLAFATSVTDTAEQVVLTNDPMAVATVAHQATTDLLMGSTVDVWDTATVTGFVPVGSTLEFALYRFDDAAVPVCDADTLIATLKPVDLLTGAGAYLSDRYALTAPDAAAVGFVETVYDADGAVLTQGVCGAAAETLRIIRADSGDGGGGGGLAFTGAEGVDTTLRAAGGVTLVGAALLVVAWVVRRRRYSQK